MKSEGGGIEEIEAVRVLLFLLMESFSPHFGLASGIGVSRIFGYLGRPVFGNPISRSLYQWDSRVKI